MSRPVLALLTTLLIQVLASLALMTAPVLAPEVAQSYSFQATKVGVFISVAYAAATIASLFSGFLVERFGAIRTSQISLLLCAIGLVLTTFGGIVGMLIGAYLLGTGYGPITPASSQILARTTPQHMMSMFFSLKQTGVPLGGALAGLMLPIAVINWQWQGAVFVVVSLCVLGMLACQFVRANFDDDLNGSHTFNIQSVLVPFKAVIKNTDIRRLAICSLFFSIVQMCLATYIVTYLTVDLGITLTLAGIIMFVVQGSGVVGRIVWGLVADRWLSSLAVLIMLGFAMGASSFLMAMVDSNWSVWFIIILCMVFGATAIGWNGVYLAEVARLSPIGQAGLMTGGTLFFTYLGVVVGPPVFAFAVEKSNSFAFAFVLLGAMITLAAVGLLRQYMISKKALINSQVSK
ncbi:MAG: MFS transporter [Alcaligenaceae bacterium]|nr:MFS transporter [Alcaligenaceae bacterium]